MDLMALRRSLLMVPAVVPGGLPAEYLAVQYIESTGTQCIDTGVVPDSNTDVLLTKGATSGSYLHCLFGANSSANNQYSVNATGAYFYGRNDYFTNSINLAGTIKIVGGKIYYNDTLLLDYSETTGQSSKNLVLFGRTTNQGVYERFISMKVYAFKMWQNNVLIRDMIPCISISDSKPGMYDLVGRQFYTNAGTGEFVVPTVSLGTWQQGTVGGATASADIGKTYTQMKRDSTTRIRVQYLVGIDSAKEYVITADWTNYKVVMQPYDSDGRALQTIPSEGMFGVWHDSAVVLTGVPNVAIAVCKVSEANIDPSEISNAKLAVSQIIKN